MTTTVYHPLIEGLSLAVAVPDAWVEQGWLLDDPSAPPSTDHTDNNNEGARRGE